jgi:hypothetical protein
MVLMRQVRLTRHLVTSIYEDIRRCQVDFRKYYNAGTNPLQRL